MKVFEKFIQWPPYYSRRSKILTALTMVTTWPVVVTAVLTDENPTVDPYLRGIAFVGILFAAATFASFALEFRAWMRSSKGADDVS